VIDSKGERNACDHRRGKQETMKTLRKLIHSIGGRQTGSRFERYYGGVVGHGAGYPTADEARRDLRNYDSTFTPYTWPR
jgi:hypothetical protein